MSSKPHATTRSAAAAGRSLFRSEEAANVPSSKVVSGPYSSQSLAKHNSGCPPVKGIKHQAEGSVGFEDDLASSIDGGLASSAVSRTHDGGLASSAVSRTHGGEDVASHRGDLAPSDDHASNDGLASAHANLQTSGSGAIDRQSLEEGLEAAMRGSPAVQALSKQVVKARDAFQHACSQKNSDEDQAPPLTGDDRKGVAEDDHADLRLVQANTHHSRHMLALQARLHACEDQLEQALQVERERFIKRTTGSLLTPTQKASSAVSKSVKRVTKASAVARQPAIPLPNSEDSSPERDQVTVKLQSLERRQLGRYDAEERRAIRSSHPIVAETRSPDSPLGQRDRNGYDPTDGFAVPDESFDLSLSSSPSTDDDSATSHSSDDNSRADTSQDRAARMEIIALAMQRAQSKSGSKPPFQPTAPTAELAILRAADVHVKRRVSHLTPMVELLLNAWLRNDTGVVEVAHVAEFLRLLRQHQLEYAKSIYFVLCKRIRPVSFPLFKFLYFCISRYLPMHKTTILDAYRDVLTKLKLFPEITNTASARSSAPPRSTVEWKAKPTSRPPTIPAITDIAYAVGKFHDEYKAYKREHESAHCHFKTVFQCLSCDQQSAFAATTMMSDTVLDSMDDQAFFELWRTTFGLRSSASVLQAVRSLCFAGDPLIPSSWTEHYRIFERLVAQAPLVLTPPSKVLARSFVSACPDAFLRNDVLANEPESVRAALQLIISRLNDSGFLRSALAYANANRAERAHLPANAQAHGSPFSTRRLDGNGYGPSGGTAVVSTRHSGSHDQRPRENPRPAHTLTRDSRSGSAQPQPLLAKEPPRPTPAAVCKRCRKSGHTENACISKHDVDGNKLERQDAEVYAKRKEQARLETAARIKIQAVCDATDSDTEDVDAECNNIAVITMDDDASHQDFDVLTGVLSISEISVGQKSAAPTPAVKIVPAPSLLLCGDIEPNPGPPVFKRKRSGKHPGPHHVSHCHLETTAIVLSNSTRPISQLRRNPSTPVNPALGLISLIVFLVLWRFARIKTQRAAAIKVQSLDASQYAVYGDGVNPDQFIYYVCARPATWCSRYDSCVPPPSLLMDGDVEPNPGPFTAISPMTSTVQDCDATFDSADDAPHQRSVSRIAVAKHQPSVFLSPSSRRRPVKSIPRSFFSPPLPQTVSPTAPSAVSPDPDSPLPTPNMALNSSSSDIDRDNTPASVVPWSTIQAVFGASSDSDTSDVDEAPAIPSIASTLPIDGLLLPPKFNAFIVPVGTTNPPPKSSAQVCAIDTMCQGQYSVVSKELADRLNLPRKPCDISARTASGAIVTCTSLATFAVTVFILGTWISLPTQALVWKTTAEPILLSNSFALTTGLIEFVKPNDERVPLFGRAAFALYWKQAIASHETSILAAYHEDVMPEEADDFIDLDAPLRCGDQDVSALPPDALAYAQKYPEMTRAIPRDAHPSLDRWEAHVQEDKIPLYSWPKVELKDLKEEPLPFAYTPLLHKEFDKLKAMHYAEEVTSCPTAVAMRAQLVSKSKTEKRFCVNGSTQKNILAVASYPMPHIRQIFAFVSSFPYRAKIDLKHGYHNFEIHPESRKWTVTIGAGRAIQWRKLVQGFAPSGAFFQYAMCRLLGPNVVWKIAAVYLDDIIVVGKTKDECATNVATIMARLASVKFRINFSKCVFTPSENIDFLGCRLEGVLVHPGPKVSTMLSRIRSPHEQHTPKAQRHHLHVFLGMCAFIMQHCPGLKQALAPLYIAVASDPYHYGDLEKAAFTKAMAMLAHLQPFFLPSHDPEVTVEVMTDASGGVGTPADPGSWAIVLGQRKGPFNPDDIASGFELLQSDGGVFNARQSLWDILKKEASALFQAFWRFRAFLYGRRVRIITDSKVLIFMFRSEIPMIKRWHAFIQTFDYVMVHVSSERNALADALTRCIHIAPQTLPTGSRLLSFAAVDIPAPSLLRDGDVEPNPGPVSDVIVIPDSDDEALVVAPVTEPSPRTEYSLTPQSRRRQRQRRPAPGPTSAQTEAVNDDVSTAQPQAPSIPRERQRARQGPSPPEAIPAAMPENERDFKAGIDPRWPIHETALRIHRTDPSTSALCTAFSDSLRYEQVSSQRGRLVNEPPFRPLDVRERTLWFMAEYPNTVVDSRIGLSTRSLFNSSLLANALHLAFDHTEDRHSPTSWSEYQTLMADDGTYPDIIFIHAAARLYRCQIVMFIENDDEVPYIVIAPPHAFRRIFLFASSSLQRVNWAYPTTDETSVDVADATFHAPLLAPPPTQFEVNDEALHSLYNRLPVNDERLRQIHLAHNGYSGHSGVERTVRSLVSVGSKWRGMTADVAQFIRRCPTCCASRLKLQYAPVSASSLRLSARPLSRWHLDQTGSMPACAFTGYTRFIAFICETTQFIMLFGSRFGTALEIAIALIQLIGFFDLPEAIHSDHGSENENYIWHQVQQITGIKRTFSMPYVPQTNGIAERAIGSAKQFIRNLSIDVGRHNSWGLLLPIAQKGLNSLPREELMWYSPSQVIFASCHTPDHFAIPTFYSRAMREIDFANAHAYHVSGNFGHRAMIFQQHVFNHFHALRERALDEAAAREPSALQDLQVGQAVLVDWPSGGPPSPLHPCKQGPFRVAEIRRNVVVLQHIETPPPDKQPSILQWSKQAHVYMYPHAHVPDRSASDPSAAMSPLGQTRRQIECVISHRPLRGSQARQPRTAHQRHHVQNFEYTCRLFAADLPDAAIPHMLRVFTYEDIQHTYAFDCYVLAHRSLEGHVPISHMPSTFQPQAVARSLRPSHDPCPSHEHFTHHSGNSSDTSDIDSVNDDHAQTPNSA